MKRGTKGLSILALLAVLLAPAFAAGQEKFPVRPLELVCPWGPGGGSDLVSRKAAHLVEKILGQPVAVFNVPGASGQTGVNKALAARADGYTVVEVVSDNVLLDAFGKSNFSYKDLVGIARGQLSYSLFFAPAESPFKTWDDLAKFVKANPGKVKVAGSGKASTDDLTVSYLGTKGLKFTYIPYNSPAERYVSPLRGETDILFEQIGDIKNFLDAKQYRPLLAFYRKRSADFPQTPTGAEVGYDIALPLWRGFAVKKGVPQDRLQILVNAFKKAMETQDYKTFIQDTRTDEDILLFGEDFQKFIEEDFNTNVRILQEIGLKK